MLAKTAFCQNTGENSTKLIRMAPFFIGENCHVKKTRGELKWYIGLPVHCMFLCNDTMHIFLCVDTRQYTYWIILLTTLLMTSQQFCQSNVAKCVVISVPSSKIATTSMCQQLALPLKYLCSRSFHRILRKYVYRTVYGTVIHMVKRPCSIVSPLKKKEYNRDLRLCV